MRRIHSRVNVRDNPVSSHVERLLRVLYPHNRCRGLIDVAVPRCLRRGTCRVGRRTSILHVCRFNWRRNKVQAARCPNDDASVSLCRCRPQQGCQYTRQPHSAFHRLALLVTQRLLAFTAPCLVPVISFKFSLTSLLKKPCRRMDLPLTLFWLTQKISDLD